VGVVKKINAAKKMKLIAIAAGMNFFISPELVICPTPII
jgi:hypothetical protein